MAISTGRSTKFAQAKVLRRPEEELMVELSWTNPKQLPNALLKIADFQVTDSSIPLIFSKE